MTALHWPKWERGENEFFYQYVCGFQGLERAETQADVTCKLCRRHLPAQEPARQVVENAFSGLPLDYDPNEYPKPVPYDGGARLKTLGSLTDEEHKALQRELYDGRNCICRICQTCRLFGKMGAVLVLPELFRDTRFRSVTHALRWYVESFGYAPSSALSWMGRVPDTGRKKDNKGKFIETPHYHRLRCMAVGRVQAEPSKENGGTRVAEDRTAVEDALLACFGDADRYGLSWAECRDLLLRSVWGDLETQTRELELDGETIEYERPILVRIPAKELARRFGTDRGTVETVIREGKKDLQKALEKEGYVPAKRGRAA